MPKYYLPKNEFKIVGTDEIGKFIKIEESLDLKVLLSLAFLTGARLTELLNVRKKDIIIDNEKSEFRIKLMTLKTYSAKEYKKAKEEGKELIKPIRELIFDLEKDPFIKEVIIPYVQLLPDENSKLFPKSKRRYQQKLLKLNKLIYGADSSKYITFHYLRHSCITFITRVLRASVSEIMDWTGHRGTSYEEYIIRSATDRFKGLMGKR